jgi:hypothetical protein
MTTYKARFTPLQRRLQLESFAEDKPSEERPPGEIFAAAMLRPPSRRTATSLVRGALGPAATSMALIRSCVAAPSTPDLFQEQCFANLVATDEGLRGAELSEDVQDFAILKHARVNRERGGRN